MLRNSSLLGGTNYEVKVRVIQDLSEQKQMIKKRRLMNIIQRGIEKELQSCTVVPHIKSNTSVFDSVDQRTQILRPTFDSRHESPKALLGLPTEPDNRIPRVLNKLDKLVYRNSTHI